MSPPANAARRPEVLAPAGDRPSLEAAVNAGADAVYFGLQGFNARARAANFDCASLGETMAFLHRHGVKGYVTLNTLVFDAELASVEATVRACAASGVDAVIVQDLGVARLVKAIAPGLPLHASTQMTCTDAGSVELARDLGAARVVLARELSLDDIADVRARTDAELEVFVHGALCVAYSGQCLTSEAIGGRSANRGACAQACRLPYELVVDGEVRDLGDRAYLLSPADLEASDLVAKLAAIGVTSLKIEGRLKGPDYVAATTRLYRDAVSALAPSLAGATPPSRGAAPGDEDARASDWGTEGGLRDAALQLFSRGSGHGFLSGVDHQSLVEARACDHRGLLVGQVRHVARRAGRYALVVVLTRGLSRGDGVLAEGGFAGDGEFGGRIWTLTLGGRDVEHAAAGDEVELWLGPDRHPPASLAGRQLWRTNAPAVERAVRRSLERDPVRVPIDVVVRGAIGEVPTFEATTARGVSARVEGDALIERGERRQTDETVLREQLGRLGDGPFVLRDLRHELAPGALVALSSLNRARRVLVERLVEASHRARPVTEVGCDALLARATAAGRTPPRAGLFVLCRTTAQAHAALDAGADGVYLDFLELTGTGAALRALRERGAGYVGVAPPRIRKPGDEKIDHYLASLAPDAVLVRGLGALREGGPAGVERVGDFSLNVTNRLTAHEVLTRACAAFTPSFDLDAAQLTALLEGPFAPFAEVVVHHPMPLFHMEHCVIAALLSEGRDYRSCGRPCDRHQVSLRDRAGVVHPVEADVGCRNTVFHGAPQSGAGVATALQRAGVRRWRIELVREGAGEVAEIVGAYRGLLAGSVRAPDVFRTLRTEGGYGVVRGSLRVLQTEKSPHNGTPVETATRPRPAT